MIHETTISTNSRPVAVAYTGILFGGWGGVKKIQLRTEDGENGDQGAVAPLSEVLEAAVICYKKFHFLIFGYLKLSMMTTNLFVISDVKQLRTGGSFRTLLLFSGYLVSLAS